MKIDDRGYSVGLNSYGAVNGTSPNGNGSSKVKSISNGSDRTDFNSLSHLLAAASNAGAADRADRVEQLRQLVASGRYQVDSQALSRSIVDASLKGE